MKNTNSYFYQDKPLFGLDVGYSSVKVMQIDLHNKHYVVSGYGVAGFDSSLVDKGVIVDPPALAKVIFELFNKNLVGEITSRRVAVAIPAARTFNRPMSLPQLASKDLSEAVRLEAEQYIPVPIDELYTDYVINSKSEQGINLLAVAVPKKVVDSYVSLTQLLGLEPVTMETTLGATSRLFVQAEQSDIPTVLIDFGSISTDITIYDKELIVTGTVPYGGDIFTDLIAKKLNVTKQEAHVIKTKYGMGVSKKQLQINEALSEVFAQLVKEIKRMIRYYEERATGEVKIGQVVTMGGGANMPGLSDSLTSMLRLPVRMCDPWQNLTFAGLQPPNTTEKSMYVTVAGLALINPKEIFS